MRDETGYASLLDRFLALLIDTLVFCGLFLPITRIVKGVWIMAPTDHRWVKGLFITDPLCLVFLAFMFFYFIILEGLAGATIGKRILGLRVIQAGGGRPGLRSGLLRNVLRLVDGLPAFNLLGVVLILRSAERTRFGDRIAGTRVIRIR